MNTHTLAILYDISAVDVLKTAQLVSGEELETAKSKINELTQLKNKTTRVRLMYITMYVCILEVK